MPAAALMSWSSSLRCRRERAPSGVANWNGPYWKNGAIPKDPWGNEYKYTSPGAKAAYDIVSYGADGKEGGDGPNKDVTN